MPTLSGKVALVTGGSRGIGAAIVKRLAREGANVAFTFLESRKAARSVSVEVERAGRRALAINADSGDPAALEGAVHRTFEELGGLDILVSSAGVLLFKSIEEFTLEDFERIVAVDLRAAFVASRAAVEHMKAGGRIVIIGSNIAHYAALPTTSFYSMVKSGLVGLAKVMARDLAPREITVNVVEPGPIATDANPPDGAYGDQLRAFMARPEFGAGDDVAGLVAYLASEESRFATGSVFTIDNGFTA
jgi:3-oxoacyl-[acyl-carrier protein] reductase